MNEKVVKQKTPYMYIGNGIPFTFFTFLACLVLACKFNTQNLMNDQLNLNVV